MRDAYDAVVIGGGLVGAAIAFGLAQNGRRICLLDEGDVAYRASRANFALVWVQGKGHGSGPYARLTKQSADIWPTFVRQIEAESDIDLGFRQPGGFTLALSQDELETRRKVLDEVQTQGGVPDLGCEIVDRDELLKHIPQIGPDVVGASYCPLDAHCNSQRLLMALHVGFARRGGVFLSGQTVERIVPAADSFRIESGDTVILTEKIVVAAGLGSARLAPMLGLSAPVTPLRGQIIVTEKLAPFLRYPIVSIRQTDEGGVMIGSSNEDAGFDTASGLNVVATIARRATRMFPLLASANIVRTWAGLRVMTPDGRPLYDQSRIYPNAFVCNCHSGVTLAATHALDLAPSIAAGALGQSFLPFGAGRFDVPQAA